MTKDKKDVDLGKDKAAFAVKKLQPIFIDEVSNISIAPNGACRVYFSTWNTNEQNENVRVDAEVIMTIASLRALATALPGAIKAADKAISDREASQETSKHIQ